MFYFWKLPHVFVMSFEVFRVFTTSANGTGNGCDEFEMNSNVLNSSSTVESLLVGKMHGLHRAAAFCKKKQLDKEKLNIACCMRTACDLLSFSCVEEGSEYLQ